MTAYLGFQNLFQIADSVGGAQPDDGYHFSDFYDGSLADKYVRTGGGNTISGVNASLDSAYEVDYVGIFGHNLAGIPVKVGVRPVGSSSYTYFDEFIPENDGVQFKKFDTSLTGNYVTVVIGPYPAHIEIAYLSVGKALQLNPLRAPFTPPSKSKVKDVVNNSSVDHQHLSKVVRTLPYDVVIPQSLVDPQWVDTNFQVMADHINERPFFFNWDMSRDDALLCWTTESVEQPRYSRYQYQDFAIRAKGVR